jgi:hypothetical protein
MEGINSNIVVVGLQMNRLLLGIWWIAEGSTLRYNVIYAYSFAGEGEWRHDI